MAVTDLPETLDAGEPLPRRKSIERITLPEPVLFGEGLADEQYRTELGLYIGTKIIITSTDIRYFEANGRIVKFSDDPRTYERLAVPLIGLSTYNHWSHTTEHALRVGMRDPRLGDIQPLVPIRRDVTTIHIPHA